MADRYAGRFEAGVLANANTGGENVHRGIVLGALLGAEAGLSGIPVKWIHGLKHHVKLASAIDTFVRAVRLA